MKLRFHVRGQVAQRQDSGLEVNFLVHLQSFAGTIFFPLANWWDYWQILSLSLGDMDDSTSQTFASGHFFHSQITEITRILRVCQR